MSATLATLIDTHHIDAVMAKRLAGGTSTETLLANEAATWASVIGGTETEESAA